MAQVDLPALTLNPHGRGWEPASRSLSGVPRMEALSLPLPGVWWLLQPSLGSIEHSAAESDTKSELPLNEWMMWKIFLSGIFKSQRKKLGGRGGKHRKMSIYREEHWAEYLGSQDLIWVLPLWPWHMAQPFCFLSFRTGMLIPFPPTSEALEALKEIWMEYFIWKHTKYYENAIKCVVVFLLLDVLCPQSLSF